MSDRRRIKIAYLLEYPIDLAGGAQMSTESLCRGIVEYNSTFDNKEFEFQPIVVCPRLLSKTEGDYPFEIRTYPMVDSRIKNILVRIKAFRKIISEIQPDIVHIQMPESLATYGLSLMGTAKKPGILRMQKKYPHLIFTDRGLYYGYRRHTMALMQFTLKKADMLLTTTDFNRNMWLEGSKVRPIERVANTISDKFLEYDETKRNCSEDGESLKRPIRIGLAGRICEEKNWPFAVELIGRIADAGIPIEVKLVLSVFEDGDDKKVKNILEGIKAAIGEENLEFHQDYSQSQMQDYYYDVDVFVMTSQFESFGKAAVEAMSRKCAVISTAVGGLPEVIGKEDNLYTVDTPERAVEYIRKVYEDKDFLVREQNYFFERYKNNFSQKKCLMDHLNLYKKMIVN